jgi:hypothetical protein
VCEVAQEFIARYGLQHRIRTHTGEMWRDPFPLADLPFYSYISHDWILEKCRFLTRKSFNSLESGGRLIVREIIYDEKAGPFPVAVFSMAMMGWAEGEQCSGRELSAMFADVGFPDVQVQLTFGHYRVVTGVKPGWKLMRDAVPGATQARGRASWEVEGALDGTFPLYGCIAA